MSTIHHESPAAPPKDLPVRAGVFVTVAETEKAVRGLLDAGFTKKEITVICSNEAAESHFQEFEHQDPAGAHTSNAALAGGTIGMLLGGLAGVSGIVATGGLGLLATGAIVGVAGASTGTFVGAMMTRGFEKSLADFYDQAVVHGNLLVGVEAHGPGLREKLMLAERILENAGAQPAVLPKG